MGMVKYTTTGNEPITEQALAELNALKDRQIDYSDIPAHTSEELEEMRLMAVEMRKKQMFSLRLKTSTIKWWKSLGNGYTGIMARLLDEATRNPEWVKKCL